MKSDSGIVLLLAFTVALLAPAAPAMAAQAFMRTPGVNGPIHRDGQPGWFKADNFKWGSLTRPAPGNQPPRSGGGGFRFTKSMDSASNSLMQFCAQGQRLSQVTIDWIRTPGSKKPRKYIVYNVRMTECPDAESPGLETYVMDFSNIKWAFTGQKNGKKPAKWKHGK